jgi:CHAD domain-containing protein
MLPHEICRQLGEVRFKEMFMSLNAAAMKQSMLEAGLSAIRTSAQVSIRKRNEEWARRLWATVAAEKPSPCKLFMFEWLRQTKTDLLTVFLDSISVPHQKGLTDADFMKDVPEERLIEAAKSLLAHPKFDRRDVAAYLLFLDYSNETERFASLDLGKQLS